MANRLKQYIRRIPLAGMACLASISISVVSPVQTCAETQTVTYLENSDHELVIYYITGREPGKTMMIIGGIQGDEPGGYLAADLYADMILEKGSLIVVPRANFNSIRRNQRGVNGDMNRKFSSQETVPDDTEQHVVDILKSLIRKSDVLLNLHEGSGFYSPTYISDSRNPMRYGQSIIADASSYAPNDSVLIDLEGPANRVVASLNSNIRDTGHYFRFNNHNTISAETTHLEQRKSATYFALTQAGIPAFGIETSKDISPVSVKVKYQTLAINAFMAEYGIIPEHPSVALPEPELDYLVVEIIGSQHHFAVKNGETLSVPRGSSVHVTDIMANYHRGLSIDIRGFGDTNDLGQVAVVNGPTIVDVYKDAFRCGGITIDTEMGGMTKNEPSQTLFNGPAPLQQVMFAVDGKNIVVSAGDTLHIVRGDAITVTEAQASKDGSDWFRINFVGFVGNKSINDAEDRGYSIDTGTELMDRFSLDGNGALYQVKAEDLGTKESIGSVYVRLSEPAVEYLIVQRSNGDKLALEPGAVVEYTSGEQFSIIDVISNITAPPYLETYLSATGRTTVRLAVPETIEPSAGAVIQFRRAAKELGTITFRTSG